LETGGVPLFLFSPGFGAFWDPPASASVACCRPTAVEGEIERLHAKIGQDDGRKGRKRPLLSSRGAGGLMIGRSERFGALVMLI
jgi:hypothetical protein